VGVREVMGCQVAGYASDSELCTSLGVIKVVVPYVFVLRRTLSEEKMISIERYAVAQNTRMSTAPLIEFEQWTLQSKVSRQRKGRALNAWLQIGRCSRRESMQTDHSKRDRGTLRLFCSGRVVCICCSIASQHFLL
jgi:hypothetical protein